MVGQDGVDTLMLVSCGTKRWAVGELPESLVSRLRRLPAGLDFDAFEQHM